MTTENANFEFNKPIREAPDAERARLKEHHSAAGTMGAFYDQYPDARPSEPIAALSNDSPGMDAVRSAIGAERESRAFPEPTRPREPSLPSPSIGLGL